MTKIVIATIPSCSIAQKNNFKSFKNNLAPMKLLSILIAQQWKQAVRSSIWQKNLAVNLIMGFFFFLLFLEAVVVAFVVGYNWHEIVEKGDPLFEMHRVFAWYFAATLAMRFFF
ncbi:DUF5687 family protein, partial [Arthrospira platensis SPKY1]|nr:DUF5687 family protein [Arthrospira platensis SPKY1]